MDIYGKLKNRIQKMCQTPSDSALILAKVKNVDGQTCTVTIDDLELADVRLRAVVNDEESGIVITPTVGSFVMITDLSNGDKRDWAVVMYSEIDKIEINGGKNGGLIKIEDLVSRLNAIEDDINNLKTALSSWVPTAQDGGAALKKTLTIPGTGWATKQLTKTKTSDLEDDKITH